MSSCKEHYSLNTNHVFTPYPNSVFSHPWQPMESSLWRRCIALWMYSVLWIMTWVDWIIYFKLCYHFYIERRRITYDPGDRNRQSIRGHNSLVYQGTERISLPGYTTRQSTDMGQKYTPQRYSKSVNLYKQQYIMSNPVECIIYLQYRHI